MSNQPNEVFSRDAAGRPTQVFVGDKLVSAASQDNMNKPTDNIILAKHIYGEDSKEHLMFKLAAAEAQRDAAVAALRECLDVLELPEPTPDAYGTTYTATQRSGSIAKAKLQARTAIAAVEGSK